MYGLVGKLDTVVLPSDIPSIEQYGPPIPVPPGSTPPPHQPPIPGVPTTIWRHSGYKAVVLTQRVTRIQLRCPDTHSCDPISAGAQANVWADGFDALGFGVVGFTSATANPAVSDTTPLFATFTVRDTTIASASPVGIRVATIVAKRAGSTWIVANRQSLLDSLQIIVR